MISDEKKENEKQDGEGGEEEGEERLRTEMNRTQNHTHDPPLPLARTQISPRRLLHQVPASCEQRKAETTENQTIFFFLFTISSSAADQVVLLRIQTQNLFSGD